MNETDGPTTSGQSSLEAAESPPGATLSGFQRDLLQIIATLSDTDVLRSGKNIRMAAQERLNEPQSRGRVYPNLDELVESGLVEKTEHDRRTNVYSLTQAGCEGVWYHDDGWDEAADAIRGRRE